jgi:hypothetical protein
VLAPFHTEDLNSLVPRAVGPSCAGTLRVTRVEGRALA